MTFEEIAEHLERIEREADDIYDGDDGERVRYKIEALRLDIERHLLKKKEARASQS